MPALTARVALLSYDDVPPIGGQGRYAGALEQTMPKIGYEVDMVTARRTPWGPGLRIPKRTRRAPLDFSLWLRRRLPEVATALRPDLWHALGGPGGVLLFRHPPTAPLVYTANHTYRTAHGRRLATRPLGSIEARAYRFSEHVISISPSTASSLAADYAVPADKISVIPVGIDTEWLRPDGGYQERDTLLFVGRLVPIKGVPQFIAAFRELSQKFPRLRAEICGEGPLYEAAQAAAPDFNGRLLVRGRVSESELARSYQRALLLVVPSRYEGLGVVALEAMASGTPVLATDVPGLTDLKGGGVALVPLGDAPAMLAAAESILGDKARWDQLSGEARATVLERFSWDAVGPQIAQVYRSVLGSRDSQVA
ncbi:MAG TPA: glycosyltransferase family 4 protein [Candidatus Dormibacteraeota bacterium]|nr:glycosyltransferase family 4 protein [Candidatus Dormibacteraeota bacterium]